MLIVLQGIDASGKDGTITHVMRAFNPLGCRVVGFGVPNPVELAHDYLWRVHQVVPGNGEISVFNRSHYEAVLVERVHSLVPQEVWSRRYDQINAFEQMLVEEGTTILKFFLHIDRDEQKRRLQARVSNPTKRWKFKMGDLAERKLWADYMAAFNEAVIDGSERNRLCDVPIRLVESNDGDARYHLTIAREIDGYSIRAGQRLGEEDPIVV